jgi:hypothetical protein
MARLYVSFFAFISPVLMGWLILTGENPRPDRQPWWRHEDHNGFIYDTIDALVLQFGAGPVGLGLIAFGPLFGAFMYVVIRPTSIFPGRR